MREPCSTQIEGCLKKDATDVMMWDTSMHIALEVMAKRSVTVAAILYRISKSISNTAENEEEDEVEGLDVELSLKE